MDLPGWYSYDSGGTEFPVKQTKHEIYVSKYCEALFEEAKWELEQHDDIVQIDRMVNYLMGKQWVERRPSYKASPVANRMWTNLIQLVSYLTDIRQTFDVRANNALYSEVAGVLNKIVKAWFLNEGVDMTLAMIIMHSALTIGYGRLVWNPDLHNGEGELELTPVGALDVIPIKPGHHLQRSIGVIYRAPKPTSWFKEKYPLKGHEVPVDRQYSTYMTTPSLTGGGMAGRFNQPLSPQMRRLMGQGGNSQLRDSVIPMALYREFWLRDPQRNTSNVDVYVGSPEREYGYRVPPGGQLYPRGRLIIMGGPVVLYDGPNPHWHGQFPFSALRINRVPWQWPGISEFRNQAPLQDVMNNILAGILDSVKKAVNPPMVAPDNAFSAAVKKNLDPNMPNAKVFFSPASVAPPTYAQSPSLPNFVFQTLYYAQQELDAQSGFLNLDAVSRKGIIPAADTLEQMKEGQQTLVRLKVRYIEDFLKDIGTQFVANSFQFYTMSRRISMLGMDGLTWEDFDWEPATMVPAGIPADAFWRSFSFMIQPGSLLKSARLPLEAKMFNLRRLGDMDRDHLLDALDLGDMKESVKNNLRKEAADFLISMLRQKMSGTAGGGGLSPDQLSQINNATKEPPTPVQ